MKSNPLVKILFFSALLFSVSTQVVRADDDYRAVTADEEVKITNALSKIGCGNAKNLKFDTSTRLFEAEDAICKDGKKYDIYFDSNFKVVRRVPD
jgi:hypothetical protein